MSDNEAWELLLNTQVTFSVNCRSGLISNCQCWRCRTERSEPVTEETEGCAEAMAATLDDQISRLGFVRKEGGAV